MAGNGIRVGKHLAIVSQPQPRRRQTAARVLQDTLPKRRDEQIKRQVGDGDDCTVELPLRLGGVVGQLYLQRNGMLEIQINKSKLANPQANRELTGCMLIQSSSG